MEFASGFNESLITGFPPLTFIFFYLDYDRFQGCGVREAIRPKRS